MDIGKHFLLILILIPTQTSTSLKFQTRCNSSKFTELENLIGSLHANARENTQLVVLDTGLDKGQKLLLERYQNIHTMPSSSDVLHDVPFIPADHEIILNRDNLVTRKRTGNLQYVDHIRKKFHLAIVIPFVRSQMNRLTLQLNMMTTLTPCKHRYESIDLIFYHNENADSSLEKNIYELNYINRCFRKILVLAADLSPNQDTYLAGSAFMWLKLILGDLSGKQVSLRARGYTHFFLMEPDTRPIRPMWLDALVHEITGNCRERLYCATTWWITGSIYRGQQQMTRERLIHINGNALYHLSSEFVEFIEGFSHSYLSKGNPSIGYDLALFLFLLNDTFIARHLWHKFRFSEYIQNCGRPNCFEESETDINEFILRNPSTYLVHGGSAKTEVIINQHFDRTYTLFPWLFLLLLVSCNYRRLRYC